MRSAVLPGWGQFANGRPLKGLFFAGASAALLVSAIVEQRDLNQLSDELADVRRENPFSSRTAALETANQDQAGKRNTRVLFVALSLTFSAIDAYVDAHLADFGPDPELAVDPELVALTCTWRF